MLTQERFHYPKMEETANLQTVSSRIISIATGESHTLALTDDGKVYSWGRETFGRLGTGSEVDQHFPTQVKIFGSGDGTEENINFIGIAAGAYHSLALADDGSVWGWGYNTYGQTGISGENYLAPHLLEGFISLGSTGATMQDNEGKGGTPLRISSLKAGAMMSLAIDNLGVLWMWGNCPPLSLGTSGEGGFSLVSTAVPVPVWNFHGHTVVKVACGSEHVLALVSTGETYDGGDMICYSWGNNIHGQLGLGDNKSRFSPEIIEMFNLVSPWDVYEIACGAFHTALLAKRKGASTTLESFCFTFGMGENGQLGHGTTQSLLSPEIVKGLPLNSFLQSVDCGLFHTSIVSTAGEVLSWGMEKGLGLCPDARFTGTDSGDALSPLLIPHKFQDPLHVACGAAHTVVVADLGLKLWSWGRGHSGILGNGNTVDCYVPTSVLWPLQSDDSREDETRSLSSNDRGKEMNFEESLEMKKRLAAVMEEMQLLQSRLSVIERYASILHGALFGKPLQELELSSSLLKSGTFDIAKEWENMLESSDERKLVRLRMFYRDMLDGVEDKLMRKRMQEMVKECLTSIDSRNAEIVKECLESIDSRNTT